jgi:biotin transporter BioY
MGFTKAVLVAGLYPFILGDILKTLLAAAVLPAGWKFLTLLNLPLKNR